MYLQFNRSGLLFRYLGHSSGGPSFSDSGIKGCIGQVLVGIVVRLDPHLINMLD